MEEAESPGSALRKTRLLDEYAEDPSITVFRARPFSRLEDFRF
jgi:hypothetical protein